ncbi:MAG: glycosyltransferase family 4 protein [Candidatus Omnitrophica bacterium]|nr:glycosyltransferase family 4 protein [Candidatus Omnitrophota bacterium]
MRIGIDAREIQNGVFTGIGRALYNFLHYFQDVPNADKCILFCEKELPFKFSDKVRTHIIEKAATFWWDQVELTAAIEDEDIELFFSPYYKIPLFSKTKKISSVLDLMYLQFPLYAQALKGFQKFYYQTMGRRCVASAHRVLTCSEFSADDIMKVYGIDRRKIIVIPLSVSRAYYPEPDTGRILAMRHSFGIPEKYLLYTGNFKPHKNVLTLFKSFKLLSARYPGVSLVLAGPKTGDCAEIMRQAARANLSSRVIFTDTIMDEETLRLLYTGAYLFVMPSLYEGFGLPPVEAMACGTPVVCSNATCLPEVTKDSALLVDARNTERLAEAVKMVLEDKVLHRELSERGLKRALDFSQEKIAKRMYDLFRLVVEG